MASLQEVKQLGQQIWLDNLSRNLVQSGELANMLTQGVCGVTSNPAIFQKAFSNDKLYIPQIEALKKQGMPAQTIYETLAIADVQAACDVCRATFDQSNGQAGFVSLEVSPKLSHDAAGTIVEAQRLFAAIDRPNVMIKIPATDEGLMALTELIAQGLNINLTLLFSRQQTRKAYDAYCAGLNKCLAAKKEINHIRVVASFFISRIDNALDATLPAHLQGKVAISLAKAAYQDWQNYFSTPKFTALAEQGANKVALLWASTGVKNPAYPDTLYVDSLIGEYTVNTVPDSTLTAFMDHGTVAPTLNNGTENALSILSQTEQLGINLETLATRLQQDGLKQFEEAFTQLLTPLE